MTSSRYNIQSQIEHLQAKYTGTGNPDWTKHDWALNIHRDSIASYVGHPYLLTYIATASGQSQGRTRYDQMERLLAPVGPAPKKPAEHEAPAKLVPSGPVALTSTHPALLSEVKTEPKK